MDSVARYEDWRRLADEVRSRRGDLGLTQQDVSAAGGPSTATMRLIEGALQDAYLPAILRRLEDALAWKRGSVRAVLAGGAPVPLGDAGAGASPAAVPFPPAAPPAAGRSDRDVRAALHAALAAVNAPLRDVVLAEARAGMPFTDPVEKAIWESPDWSTEEKAGEIANFRARRAEFGENRAAAVS